MQLPAVSHRIKMAGQIARYAVAEILQQILQDSESELPGVTDYPDIDDDYVLHLEVWDLTRSEEFQHNKHV